MAHDLVIHAESLLHFEPVPFEEVPEADWLFFYSKNAVRFLVSQIEDKELLKSYKIGCFGKSTSTYFADKANMNVDFIGSGLPKEVATNFKAAVKTEKVLFIQATQSRKSIQKNWGAELHYRELVVYDNQIKPSINLSKDFDIAILTSPLNAKAFLEVAYKEQQVLITMGKTTSNFISSTYNIHSYQPNQPSLESIISLLDQILKES